jgi:hypothetical protein
MASSRSEWARRRAELLWRQHTKPISGAESAPKSGGAVIDLKTARLRALRLAREIASASGAPPPSPAREDAQWLKHYGQHLGRLYEPPGTLPRDLDQLVSAIAAEAAQPDDWPNIY